jgi:flagellar motor switch protein FliN/FliY
MKQDEIVQRLIAELVRVAATTLGTSGSTRPGHGFVSGGFVAVITARDGDHGSLRLFAGRGGAEAIARAMQASSGILPDEAIVDSLRELLGQATAACDPRIVGGRLVVQSIEPVAQAPDGGTDRVVEIVLKGQEQPLQISIEGHLDFLDGVEPLAPIAVSKTLDVILDIELPLVVRFGRTELPLKTLTSLGPGSVIDLGRQPDEPVDILISNRVVARGEVVIVSGHYGVRVRDVMSPAERTKSLEAQLS